MANSNNAHRLKEAAKSILLAQKESGKPLAIVLAGHNGSGKSTMWYDYIVDMFQIPLINADRMMKSILPDVETLPVWASNIRDNDKSWMKVAQKGVEIFVAQAMANKVPFAMETVFSHWKHLGKAKIESKIDLIKQMQDVGYFVLLIFVGLANHGLSEARVQSRFLAGGHNVDRQKLISRFPRTQKAMSIAVSVSDAAILTDNSLTPNEAFTVCRIQMGRREMYDLRNLKNIAPAPILEWLNVVCPK